MFNGDCLFSCPVGFYKLYDQINNAFICNKCNDKCMTCTSLDNCVQCLFGFSLYFNNLTNLSMCVQTCPK
jgi:hypothetical protein